MGEASTLAEDVHEVLVDVGCAHMCLFSIVVSLSLSVSVTPATLSVLDGSSVSAQQFEAECEVLSVFLSHILSLSFSLSLSLSLSFSDFFVQDLFLDLCQALLDSIVRHQDTPVGDSTTTTSHDLSVDSLHAYLTSRPGVCPRCRGLDGP